MEKKYLMLLPLAVPLFFGGKAAVTAIKRRKTTSEKGNGNVVLPYNSPVERVMESDTHIDELRTSTGISGTEEETSTGTTDTVNMDAELPEIEAIPSDKRKSPQAEKDNPTVLGEDLEEKTIFTGPKGGKYYLNEKGKKIYIK
jgi:hypothetical protein